MNLRYPNLTAGSADGQVRQLISYLHQLVNELNMNYQQQEAVSAQISTAVKQTAASVPKSPTESFNNIKGLIINSADIVERYGEKIETSLSGRYVAVSDFGTYTEEQLAHIGLSSDSLRNTVANVQKISGDVELMKQNISSVEQKADAVEIRIGAVESDGVNAVKTSTGYTFDKNGLRITKDGEPVENLLDNTGMYVKFSGATILQANGNGVVGKDMTVQNYLRVGEHARFEDYGSGRTACFWVGGN